MTSELSLYPLALQLENRGITPLDLEDTVMALIEDQNRATLDTTPEEGRDALQVMFASEAETLTAGGLVAQLAWMWNYYGCLKDLKSALAGFLNLPTPQGA